MDSPCRDRDSGGRGQLADPGSRPRRADLGSMIPGKQASTVPPWLGLGLGMLSKAATENHLQVAGKSCNLATLH